MENPPPSYLLDTLFNRLRGGGLPGVGAYVAPPLNHAGCVINTRGVFSFLSTCQPGPLTERLSIFSDPNAVKVHMHVQHKLGPNSEKVSNHQSTKCYTKYQELIKEYIVKKDISDSL